MLNGRGTGMLAMGEGRAKPLWLGRGIKPEKGWAGNREPGHVTAWSSQNSCRKVAMGRSWGGSATRNRSHELLFFAHADIFVLYCLPIIFSCHAASVAYYLLSAICFFLHAAIMFSRFIFHAMPVDFIYAITMMLRHACAACLRY